MLLLIILFVVGAVHSELEYDSYRVWQVTEGNLNALTSKHPQLYLFMHQPGCRHSEEYKQRYAQLAINLQEADRAVATGVVDCNKEYKLCGRLGITNFPTLLLFEEQKHKAIDEIEFLYQLESQPPVDDEKYQTNMLVRWL